MPTLSPDEPRATDPESLRLIIPLSRARGFARFFSARLTARRLNRAARPASNDSRDNGYPSKDQERIVLDTVMSPSGSSDTRPATVARAPGRPRRGPIRPARSSE